jgi:hypothetical protein
MRRLYRRVLFFILGPALAAAVCVPCPAASAVRSLYVVNAGTQPVYAIRIGHRATGIWSDDLLSPTEIVDVGDSRRVHVTLADTCWYDIRFEYGDGYSDELDDVDLCSATPLFLKH